MRRIGIAISLTILLLASLAIAQQPASNNLTTAQETGSPTPPPGPIIGGMGTANYIPLWAAPTFIVNSAMYQTSGGNVGVGTTTPAAKLDVNGSINAAQAYEISGTNVVSIGYASDNNLFLGVGAGAENRLGYGLNTFVGAIAGLGNTTGQENTFVGWDSGFNNTTANYNTFVGAASGYNTFGSGNTFYGFLAGVYNASGHNDIYIGNTGPMSGTESNTIRIGGDNTSGYGTQTAAYIVGIYGSTSSSGIPVYINSNGQLGTQTSSFRFKEQVRDMGNSTDALMKLRPVTFLYKPEYANGERTLQYGLIAEEVAKVYPELVAYDKEGQPYSVRYQYLSTMLLNEVQKQYRRSEVQSKVIETQQREIESLKQQLKLQNATLQERVSWLEKLVGNESQIVAQK